MRLIRFGEMFHERAIPQVRALPVAKAIESPWGYDGQFYAQLAIDPLLRGAETKNALDTPCYRARRIGLPALAYAVGLGKPAWILQAFALLNFVFWGALAFGMCHFLRPETVREHLCVIATCLTSGVFFSLQRALPDLPAATFAFYGASLAGAAIPVFAAAILTKEIYVLALISLPWKFPATDSTAGKSAVPELVRVALGAFLALAPMLCWYGYLRFILGGCPEPLDNFTWPFAGYLHAFSQGFAHFFAHRTIYSATEILAPFSLLIQVVWLLLIAPRPADRFWRMGAVFVLLSLFMSDKPFAEPIAYCRDLLPITIAFNIGLMREKIGAFLLWFIAGNIGLTWGVLSVTSW